MPAGAVLAFLALTLPRVRTRSLWVDEAITLGAVRDLPRTLGETGGTMALYYALVAPVAAVTHDRLWLRLPSVVAVAATVWVTYAVGRRLGRRRLGGLAAGFVALSWFAGRYAMEVRGYALALLLSSLSWLGLVAAVGAEQGPTRRRWWALFVVTTLLAPLAHGISALQLVAQGASLALAPDRRRWAGRLALVAAAVAVEVALLFGLGAGEVANWVEPLNAGQLRNFSRALVGVRPLARVVVGVALVAGAVVALRAAGRERDVERWRRAVPIVWATGLPLLLVTISLVRPYGVFRYLLTSLPGVALLAASAVDRIPRRVPLAFAALVLAVALWSDRRSATAATDEPWSQLADRLAESVRATDGLVMPAPARPAFDVAWNEERRAVDPVPLRPVGEVGEVRRFYDEGPWSSSLEALVEGGVERVWYIDRGHTRRDDVAALIGDPAVRARYRVVARHGFDGDLVLIGLEARGEP